MTIDENTGLPKLPQNQFWRISRNEYCPSWPLLSLVERYLFQPEPVIEKIGRRRTWNRIPPAEERLRVLETTIFNEDMGCSVLSSAENLCRDRAMYGDYPPKRYGQEAS